MPYWEVYTVRYYVPDDSDGLEPTDFDVYYDYPAETDKGLAARFYVKIERDPSALPAWRSGRTQPSWRFSSGSTTTEPELRAKGKTLPDSWPE